ncbi:FtsX-like permease family protein [Spirosoma endbachense]|uniref:FtsX-like permease family protein n=1 Tax=Spirosoma endbachense TaxID=2666025 RepID=A0A6P1W5M3_9BACT|nr:FtsX-like permease family protein [Spirosoma endbachense]QHW00644.1 FtsX-like permease family protein [Spirosoma endbachense]
MNTPRNRADGPVRPPRWANRLLEWFCAPHLLEELEGDLQERFERNCRLFGVQSARRQYGWEVIGFFRPRAGLPFFLKRKPTVHRVDTYSSYSLFSPVMIRNYMTIAWRNLARNKGYSFINIFGLATGMAVAMLNGLWIWDELSFNTYHQNYDHIAQVRSREYGKNGVGINSSLQYPLITELKRNYKANFKHIVEASWDVDNVLSAGQRQVSRKGLFMEAAAPEMLTLKMIYGTRSGLQDPHSILLSESTSKALFGDTDPVNQLMKINNKLDVKVTGVYEDLPLNTQFNQVKFLAPFDLWVSDNPWIKERAMTDWQNHFLKIYAEINPDTDFEKVSADIKDAELKNLTNFAEEAKRAPEVFLLPMRDWHLHNYKRGALDNGPMQMVWLISIIGAFVLLLACINFMNLSTARSEKRAKEVGIRKAVGSVRMQLVNQFFSESFLVVILAFVLAILLTTISLPWFNDLAAKQMTIPWTNQWFWIAGLLFISFTGILAGSYPALYLSSFQPINVLKGTVIIGRFASMPRKVLVVLQFTVSVTLIIGTIIVFRQIQFAKNRPVGYSRDGLLMVEMKSGDFYGKHELLRSELRRTGVVAEMSESMGRVTEVWSGNDGFTWKGKNPSFKDSFGTLVVTPEYGKTVGWQFVKGRDFSREFMSDSSGMVINEAAAKYMELENPVGEAVSWKFQERELMHYRILGVVKDMVMESPYEPISPTIFMIRAHGGTNWIHIKIDPNASANEALPKIEAVFKKLIPTAPFEYKFADQEYALKFAAEDRIGKLASLFAVLAIFISCLGLFGLSSFIAEQRTKEIGIRKVLGASVFNLWRLLSKDFVVLVFISLFIAIPIAYYFMGNWIQKYTYRAEISWWIFAVSGLVAIAITLLTVSFQSIKAALMNPVTSLRSD